MLVFLGVGFVLAGLAQLVIGFQMISPDTPLEKMADDMVKAMTDPKNVNLARLSQVLGTFLLLFVPAALFSLVVNGKNPFWLGFNKYINARQIGIGFLIIFTANIMASPLADLSKYLVSFNPQLDKIAKTLEDTYTEQVMALSHLNGWGEYIAAIFIMAFFPAMFEELFFRGVMQNLFEKWWKSPVLAIIVTSIFFSIIHFSIYLFVSRAVLGFALGMMYYKTRNIWVNIIAHFLNNAIAVTQLFYLSQKQSKINVDELDPTLPWWAAVIALVVLYFLFVLLEKVSENNKARIVAKEQALLASNDPFHSFAQQENIS